MTWNIQIGLGMKPRLHGNDPTVNLGGIADFITSQAADIVLLQEVDRGMKRTNGTDEPATLAKATGMNVVYAPAFRPPGEGGEYGIGVLSRFPVRWHRVVRLFKPDYSKSHPNYPDYYCEPRVALVCGIDTPSGPVTVVNAHLGLTLDQRREQLREIMAQVRREMRGGAVVFGGDLNSEPDEEPLAQVRVVLRDCYQGFTDGDGGMRQIPIVRRLSWPSNKPEVCIDYLFVSPRDLEATGTEVLDCTLSDHRPVVTRLARRAAK